MVRSGTRLERYVIGDVLGAGGMGEVYRARDERLDREVAVKVLPHEVAADPDRLARFEREARALARLSHPNILAIHDFGHDGEVAFAVTELLEGETLRGRIDRERLPWRKAVEIAAAIADGLAAAHTRGIVHRDLKPDNVFLTDDGVVKILDFGLARLESEPFAVLDTVTSPAAATVAGAVLGTVGYMAPEQVRGEPADARSDIFALGCVLHEMLTGRPAFRRDNPAETTAAILKEPAPELTSSAAGVTPELDRVVGHCLEKRPGDRFQSARDTAFALRALLTAPMPVEPARARSAPRRRTLVAAAAVLAAAVAALLLWAPWRTRSSTAALDPGRVVVAVFDNQTGDPSLDPLGRMVAERITQGLSEVEGVEAVPAGGTTEAAPGGDPLIALAARSGAGTVVSGTYYLQGPNLELQAKITDAARGTLLYAVEPVAGARDAAGESIETLRQRIMGAVFMHLASDRSIELMKPPLYDAYREYEAGMDLFGSDYAAAIRHFERAAEIDPEFSFAQLYVATSLSNQGDWAGADAITRRLNDRRERMTPYERDHLDWLRAMLAGHTAEALQAVRRALELAPSSGVDAYLVGLMAVAVNRPQETVDTFTSFAEEHATSPDGGRITFSWWYIVLAEAHHMLGSFDRELAVADAAVGAFPDSLTVRGIRVRALVALGRLEEADRAVEESLAVQARAGTAPDLMIETAIELRAHGHPQRGLEMAQRAVRWLRGRPPAERTRDEHLRTLAHALTIAERWDEARPAWEEVARRYPLAEESSGTSTGQEDSERVPDTVKRIRAIDAAGSLGMLAARRHDRDEALRLSERLAALEGPYIYGDHTYWRACIAAQLGDTSRAIALLRQSLAQGADFGLYLHRDQDLEPLWHDPEFEELLRPKG